MSLRNHLKIGMFFFAALSLSACIDTGVKKLGTSAAGTGSTTTDAQGFSITLAYRDPVVNTTTVVLQGIRDVASANLTNLCGTGGTTCTCLFYQNSADTTPLTGVVTDNGISAGNNSFSCKMPAATGVPASYNLVRLKTSDGTKITGFIPITTTLTINDIIGNLDKTKVMQVYRYGCVRTFFEGEGVSAGAVNCPASQKLGLITATYNYYLKKTALANNFAEKAGTVAYEQPICMRQFTKLACDSATTLQWGLYSEKKGPFQVAVTMTSSPVINSTDTTYGYAALPDTNNNCPIGLVKVRPWVAQPASIIQGSIDGLNPPSSFVNQTNNLNNTVVEEAPPTSFTVNRQANATTCRASHTNLVPPDIAPGDCTPATFAGQTTPQTVTYSQLTPVICVLPKVKIDGLF